MEAVKVTPMMQQYLQIKERYRDAILFFRLGDFYEMFFEDAHTASKILDIALTSRSRSEDNSVPLCGVPYHSAEPYIQKLLDAGHKVAVCEQMEDPALAKGVVKREVVRVITPGTVTAVEALDARGNNYLAAVCKGPHGFGLALTDITTGEFRCTQVKEQQSLLDELGRIQPSELLLAKSDGRLREQIYREYPSIHFTEFAEIASGAAAQGRVSAGQVERAENFPDGLRSASAITAYLEANSADSLNLLRDLELYEISNYLVLDDTTRINLELIDNQSGERRGSLLAVIDRTVTPIGARRLKQWILYPLLDESAIRERHDGVQELVESFSLRQDLRQALAQIQDLERLAGRAVAGTANPKDLVAIKQTLQAVRALHSRLESVGADILQRTRADLADLPEVAGLIARAIVDDPPFSIKEGGFIRNGYDAELDELRAIRTDAKNWIARFEAGERSRTGIQSLKVRYNRVFGYYIEITKANLKSVPENYLRKQTLANGERYITPDLKEYEAKVLNAESSMEKLELALLQGAREGVGVYYPALKRMSSALAVLDVLAALSEVAEAQHFIRPRVNRGVTVSIREGRHPVVETAVGRGGFVPNDCHLDPQSDQMILLTGPNMAGKSTYMRQIALIVILAQLGSFVPCAAAEIGIVDRIFTRIGAGDSLARGDSTFMVEMKETANILHHATERSLILLDEVGRGTSTFDGISIAWAVAESLHDMPSRPRTLFATHYHELTDLAETKERLKNFNFSVKEWRGEIIFLRNLVTGAASHSYGIHVARLAGMPAPVIARAKEILARLESGAGERAVNFEPGAQVAPPMQMGLFSAVERRLRDELITLDPAQMTPMEALNLVYKLVEEAKK
jgi:DNA mismatch repair protein MutS